MAETWGEADQSSKEHENNTETTIPEQLVSSFDYFRQGMDKLASVYTLVTTSDKELANTLGKIGNVIVGAIDELSKIVEEQGGSTETETKADGLNKYFGEDGKSAIGMNENKQEVFNARVDLTIDRIKTIIKNSTK